MVEVTPWIRTFVSPPYLALILMTDPFSQKKSSNQLLFFQREWNKELQQTKPSLIRALIRLFSIKTMILSMLIFVNVMFIIKIIENTGPDYAECNCSGLILHMVVQA
jgi:hypothetical protein